MDLAILRVSKGNKAAPSDQARDEDKDEEMLANMCFVCIAC